jgi:hypothetical protein
MRGVNWHDTRRVPGYVVPKRIPLVLDASESALAADQNGTIDTMMLTIREDLAEYGVESEILSPKPSRLPSPRVEVIVRTFDAGDAADSYVSGLVVGVPVAGQIRYAVVCQAYSPSNQLMFEGTITGTGAGTSNPRPLAESIGATIAEALVDPESTRPVARQAR